MKFFFEKLLKWRFAKMFTSHLFIDFILSSWTDFDISLSLSGSKEMIGISLSTRSVMAPSTSSAKDPLLTPKWNQFLADNEKYKTKECWFDLHWEWKWRSPNIKNCDSLSRVCEFSPKALKSFGGSVCESFEFSLNVSLNSPNSVNHYRVQKWDGYQEYFMSGNIYSQIK